MAKLDTERLSESERVKAILQRDKAYELAETVRREAVIRVKNGDTSAMQDAVVDPTPEWKDQYGKDGFMQVSARLEHWQDRPVKTVRVVTTPHARRLFNRGNLSEDAVKACEWYRDRYDESGLRGNIRSADMGREVFAQAIGGRDPLTERQLMAADDMRFVRGLMTAAFLRFFDMVTLQDVPIKQAARATKCRYRHETACYVQMAKELASAKAMLDKINR